MIRGSQYRSAVFECSTNSECISFMGEGACCLFQKTFRQESRSCQPADVVAQFMESTDYNFRTHVWKRPGEDPLILYCMEDDITPFSLEGPSENEEFVYPYPQPYLPEDWENWRDPVNPKIRSDMFYVPKKVENWDDQFEKWWDAWFWQFTPIPWLVLWSNFWNWAIDLVTLGYGPSTVGAYPSMYANWFAELILQNPDEMWGPFVYYDMFSWGGFLSWLGDALAIDFLWPVEIIEAIIRSSFYDQNWQYFDPELNIDHNRVFPQIWLENRYLEEYWQYFNNGAECQPDDRSYYCFLYAIRVN